MCLTVSTTYTVFACPWRHVAVEGSSNMCLTVSTTYTVFACLWRHVAVEGSLNMCLTISTTYTVFACPWTCMTISGIQTTKSSCFLFFFRVASHLFSFMLSTSDFFFFIFNFSFVLSVGVPHFLAAGMFSDLQRFHNLIMIRSPSSSGWVET